MGLSIQARSTMLSGERSTGITSARLFLYFSTRLGRVQPCKSGVDLRGCALAVENTLLGTTLAVASAMSLSAGNTWQSQGVQIATTTRGARSVAKTLVRTPIWLLGTGMFGLAIVLQLGSLAFAPLMLVQPIGVLALVFSVFINAKINRAKPSMSVVRAVIIAVVGVAGYVVVASMVTSQGKISDSQLIAVLLSLLIALTIAAVTGLMNHSGKRRAPIVHVLLGGMFSAFVATLGKTVILRVQALFEGGHFSLAGGGCSRSSALLAWGAPPRSPFTSPRPPTPVIRLTLSLLASPWLTPQLRCCSALLF